MEHKSECMLLTYAGMANKKHVLKLQTQNSAGKHMVQRTAVNNQWDII